MLYVCWETSKSHETAHQGKVLADRCPTALWTHAAPETAASCTGGAPGRASVQGEARLHCEH